MSRQVKHLIWLIAALMAVVVPLPSSARVQNFSVSPAEVNIDNLSLGEKAEFELTIYNKDNISHTFILTAYNPDKSQRRPGRDEFPDDSWISFSSRRVEVQARSDTEVRVKVAIPLEQKWAGKNWEIWLGVSPKSSDLLIAKLYVRLLVSTTNDATSGSQTGLIIGIIVAVALITWGVIWSRRKRKAAQSE